MENQTVLQFVSHASILLRSGESFLLTDPWYLSSAFSSWTPCPPPTINIEILEGLSKTGQLSIAISHAHPDHTDIDFLKRIDPRTSIYIPYYPDGHFIKILHRIGLKTVNEISEAGCDNGPFRLHSFIHPESRHDAIISIETLDCFVLHANDAWYMGEDNKTKIHNIKPLGKSSLFMGQGGSASGHPLTYFNYTEEERINVLEKKNIDMIISISETAKEMNFDKALAYACFTRVSVPGKYYSHLTPIQDGAYANAVSKSDMFIDLSPGDIYLPSEFRVIPVLSTLRVPMENFSNRRVEKTWSEVGTEQFIRSYAVQSVEFLEKMNDYMQTLLRKGILERADIRVQLNIEVVCNNEVVWSGSKNFSDECEAVRKKYCRVDSGVFAAVLDRAIPFEDLYTGYLAEWSRKPIDFYNSVFIREMLNFGYLYLAGDA